MKVSNTEDIGIIARQRRQELQISQVELAARTGVTRQWLTRFEHGNSEVSLSKVFAVLRELDLNVRIDAVEDAAMRPKVVYEIPRFTMPRITMPPIVPTFTMPAFTMADVIPNVKVSDIITKNALNNLSRSTRIGGVPPLNDPSKLAQVKDRITAIETAETSEGDVDE